ILLVSVLLAVHRTESRRAFWIGFALFGWAYLALTLVPAIESRLLTTKALAYLDSKVPGRPVVITGQAWGDPLNGQDGSTVAVAFSPQGDLAVTGGQGGVRIWDAATGRLFLGWRGTTENFVRIGH